MNPKIAQHDQVSFSIVFVSNASWFYGLPTNRQQLPRWLANYTRVLYSSPYSLSQALQGRVPWRQFHRQSVEIQPNLFLFSNLQVLPLVRGQIWPFVQLDRWLIRRALRRQIRELGLQKPVLWLYYPPSYDYLIDQLGEFMTCYHCTDDHAGHAQTLGQESKELEAKELEFVKAVDVVFATSRPLYEKWSQHNPNTYLMPNVADIPFFSQVAQGEVEIAPDLQQIPGPIAGFIGAVSRHKIDLELIAATADLAPQWSFVLIGPLGTGGGTRPDDLPDLPNLHLLGQRPYASLPGYVAGFDVCTIPYLLNNYTAGVFPLKFWEYLASGKPVVTTALPSLDEYYDYVQVVDSPQSFAAALNSAKNSAADPALKRQRLALAASQSWEHRAQEIVAVLQKFAGA